MIRCMLSNEKIILDQFHGARICDIVLDASHREYIEARTDRGTFYISCCDPLSGEPQDKIEYGVSP
jgi:hypothetical protein